MAVADHASGPHGDTPMLPQACLSEPGLSVRALRAGTVAVPVAASRRVVIIQMMAWRGAAPQVPPLASPSSRTAPHPWRPIRSSTLNPEHTMRLIPPARAYVRAEPAFPRVCDQCGDQIFGANCAISGPPPSRFSFGPRQSVRSGSRSDSFLGVRSGRIHDPLASTLVAAAAARTRNGTTLPPTRVLGAEEERWKDTSARWAETAAKHGLQLLNETVLPMLVQGPRKVVLKEYALDAA